MIRVERFSGWMFQSMEHIYFYLMKNYWLFSSNELVELYVRKDMHIQNSFFLSINFNSYVGFYKKVSNNNLLRYNLKFSWHCLCQWAYTLKFQSQDCLIIQFEIPVLRSFDPVKYQSYLHSFNCNVHWLRENYTY